MDSAEALPVQYVPEKVTLNGTGVASAVRLTKPKEPLVEPDALPDTCAALDATSERAVMLGPAKDTALSEPDRVSTVTVTGRPYPPVALGCSVHCRESVRRQQRGG